MIEILKLIGKKFNEKEILWAVGASVLLNKYNLIDNPNDIDILVSLEDVEEADKILKNIGIKKESKETNTYSTKVFNEYLVNGVDIDLIAGFKINHIEGSYEYIFDYKSINENVDIDGIKIPFTSLEDWYVLYSIMPNRENKVKLIEEYFNENGVIRKDLLKRALRGEMLSSVREKIKILIK